MPIYHMPIALCRGPLLLVPCYFLLLNFLTRRLAPDVTVFCASGVTVSTMGFGIKIKDCFCFLLRYISCNKNYVFTVYCYL